MMIVPFTQFCHFCVCTNFEIICQCFVQLHVLFQTDTSIKCRVVIATRTRVKCMLVVCRPMPQPKRYVCIQMCSLMPHHRSQLEEVFNRYGRLRKVWVARKPPGFAFIHFEDVRDAEDATRALDGALVDSSIRQQRTHMFRLQQDLWHSRTC